MTRLKDKMYSEIYTSKREANTRKNLLNKSAKQGCVNLSHSVKKLMKNKYAVLTKSIKRKC